MKPLSAPSNIILILTLAIAAIFLAPDVVLADSAREYQDEMLEKLRQDKAKKRLQESRETVEEAFGADEKSTFTPHQLNYGVLGKDDALMQISFKYRLGRDWN